MTVNDKEQEKATLVICKGDIVRTTEDFDLGSESYLAVLYNHIGKKSIYGAIFKAVHDDQVKKMATLAGLQSNLKPLIEDSTVLFKTEECFEGKIFIVMECQDVTKGNAYAVAFERPESMRGIAKDCLLQCHPDFTEKKIKNWGTHRLVRALVKAKRGGKGW